MREQRRLYYRVCVRSFKKKKNVHVYIGTKLYNIRGYTRGVYTREWSKKFFVRFIHTLYVLYVCVCVCVTIISFNKSRLVIAGELAIETRAHAHTGTAHTLLTGWRAISGLQRSQNAVIYYSTGVGGRIKKKKLYLKKNRNTSRRVDNIFP